MAGYLDIDLISDFNKGHRKAFDELYSRFFSMIYVFCFNLTDNREESQDITIETINNLFRKHKDFDSIPNIKAFLYIAARNRCLTYFRTMQRITDGKNRLVKNLTVADETNDIMDVEFLMKIRHALESIPKRRREVLVLLYLCGERYTYQEVADKMKISVKAVEKLRSKALANLKELLNLATTSSENVALVGALVALLPYVCLALI